MATISLADNGSTAVRHEASNSRIVSLSINPMRCSPAAVSWMAAERRQRYWPALLFLVVIAKYLLQLRLLHRRRDLLHPSGACKRPRSHAMPPRSEASGRAGGAMKAIC